MIAIEHPDNTMVVQAHCTGSLISDEYVDASFILILFIFSSAIILILSHHYPMTDIVLFLATWSSADGRITHG